MHQVSKHHAEHFARQLLHAHKNLSKEKQIGLDGPGAETLEALFLGTHGGNAKFLQDMLSRALEGHIQFRKNYYPDDPDYIDTTVQNSPGFENTTQMMVNELDKLISQLQESGTFFSMRSIGHMLWDTTMPGILGYFAALLYNQNNVAAEASPVTTLLEMYVGNDLCKMLGYAVQPIGQNSSEASLPENRITGWGHITCDGSVANLEGLWMARNLKFYPVSLRAAIQNEVAFQGIKDFQVKLLNGTMATLATLDDWTVLNLPIDEVLDIPTRINKQYGIDAATINSTVSNYSVQNIGYHQILRKYLPSICESPVSICSGTRHYSWPKGAAILGIGSDNMWNIPVDLNARMDLTQLQKSLDLCLEKKIPIMNVVAIIGTTEESAVDPLADILNMRDEYRQKGLEFTIHCDAAWGGYFITMMNSNDENSPYSFKHIDEDGMAKLPMSDYVIKQYKAIQYADSITVDPHKSGYVPYPAGGLCYRNSAMRNLVSFTAPVVYHGGVDPTVGVYGVEGSKPGAAAAAVYLSHKVIRPNMDGYGKLTAECFFNAKRLYAALVSLNITDLPFFVVPLIPIPAIQQNLGPTEVQKQYEFIRDRIVNKTNEQLLADPEAFELFKLLGGDQTIVTYLYNFYNSDGTPNSDMLKVNDFNNKIYRKFSYKPYENNTKDTEIVVTSSAFSRESDGDLLLDNLRQRLGAETDHNAPINFIISTIMNPWLSNTVNGSFIPQLISIITKNVSEIAEELKSGTTKTVTT
jgi:glutamate/tyrosine decarboxylase-like PLP-dependent enzyme